MAKCAQGKWQAFFVDAQGNRGEPASVPGSFAGVMAFCRGWMMGKEEIDVSTAMIPIPFCVDDGMDAVNNKLNEIANTELD